MRPSIRHLLKSVSGWFTKNVFVSEQTIATGVVETIHKGLISNIKFNVTWREIRPERFVQPTSADARMTEQMSSTSGRIVMKLQLRRILVTFGFIAFLGTATLYAVPGPVILKLSDGTHIV